MTRPARYFAIAAAVLALVFLSMAIALGLFAAIYAVFPRLRHGEWHFWLTTIGIALFWSGFFLFLQYHPSGDLHGAAVAVAIGWLASFPLILIAQGIFLVNLISRLIRLRTSL